MTDPDTTRSKGRALFLHERWEASVLDGDLRCEACEAHMPAPIQNPDGSWHITILCHTCRQDKGLDVVPGEHNVP